MLGRNAARPFGMTPSRLVATYSTLASHRLAHWMLISKPFAMTHLQRYLSVAPQLLLTDTPPTSSPHGIPTPTLVALDSACATMPTAGATTSSNTSSSSGPSSPSTPSSPASARQLHTSSKAASAAAAAAIYQQPHGQEFLIPDDLLSSTETYDEVTASMNTAAASAGTIVTAPGAATNDRNAIAFNYLLAASWHPKSRQRTSQLLQDRQSEESAERTRRWKQKLQAAHPHPGKVDAGEDAFFHVSTPSRVALGVADGVGGWSELGVDPALFSWALMNNAENIARLTDSAAETDMGSPPGKALATDFNREKKVLDAQTILDGAYTELVQSGTVEAGSSTACILSLCKMTGTLRASNLGDSAFLLIRDKKCIYESPSQQHFWNCPYQLTVLPQKERERQQRRVHDSCDSDSSSSSSDIGSKAKSTRVTQPKKKYVQDLPKDAVQTSHQLQDGDVIVLATDGFWDNVFTKEAIELVDRELGDIVGSNHHHNGEQPPGEGGVVLSAEEILARVRALSKRLTNTARRFSLDVKRNTPFSQGARHIPCGGKVDDITVIVTLVRSTTST